MSDQLLYNYKAASARLGYVVSDSWLQEHKKELPHTQIGTKVAFSDAQLAEIIEMFSVRPGHSAKSVEHPVLPKQAAKSVADLRPRPRGTARKKTA